MATTGKSYSSQLNLGMMLPTTNVYDVGQIYTLENVDEGLKQLLVSLYQNLNNMALAVNAKDTGYYPLQEFLTGKLLFPNVNPSTTSTSTPVFREVFRMTVNFGALPNATTKQVPHYIDVNSSYSFTSISGCATRRDAFGGIPIPYSSSTANDCIECSVDDTYITIITAADYSDYELCYITIEYIKN